MPNRLSGGNSSQKSTPNRALPYTRVDLILEKSPKRSTSADKSSSGSKFLKREQVVNKVDDFITRMKEATSISP